MTDVLVSAFAPTVAAPFADAPITTLDQWLTALRAQLRAQRAAGIPCVGRIYLATDVARRFLGGVPPKNDPGAPPQRLMVCDQTHDSMVMLHDRTLPANTIRLE